MNPITNRMLDEYIDYIPTGYSVAWRDEENSEHVTTFDTVTEARSFVRTEIFQEV